MIPEVIKNQIKNYGDDELSIFNDIFYKKSFFEKNLGQYGFIKQKFDASNYDFPEITSKIISDIIDKNLDCQLEEIHNNIDPKFLDIIEDGLTTKLQFLFYDHVERFRNIYLNFLKKTIRPIIGKDFYFQQNPTFRIFFPNPNWHSFSKAFYHTDLFLGHPLEMINIWMPITKCYSSNSISYTALDTSKKYYEKSNSNFFDFYKNYYDNKTNFYNNLKSLLQTFDAEYGEFMCFDSKCLHGTSENKTDITRISIDFRVLPADDISQFKIDYRGTGRKKMQMIPGEYYSSETIDNL